MIASAPPAPSVRQRLRRIIFEADSPAGKAFDVALIAAILLSVAAAMLESVESVRARWGTALYTVEWFFTVVFAVEYGLRLWTVERPLRYARSFYGVVDLLAVLPTFLSLAFPGLQQLLTIRVVRLLRIFRVFKLATYVHEAKLITTALRASARKISVFILAVATAVIFLGSLMYVVEGAGSGFTSVPKSVYWAVVTLTTVGYGDISPATPLGQAVAMVVMLLGYAVIAVPTGIVTVELSQATRHDWRACPACGQQGHDADATYCKHCGAPLA